MSNTPQPHDRLVIALIGTALVGLVAVAYPGLIPALALCAAVFMALALLLKL
ncbi:hypothetical protein PV729_22860 [Streptomyces europaeiscabiei]|uniref:Uncharacterized protein n=2 Tax=Streptomyces TaxID=1883 RepID=A0A100JVY4_STRSC|nr:MULTISPECIES: hypothetical protein [Streptomyces]MDX3544888.1 hypothetical protein [Streptomyces europaeiscabiei]MDX3554576.1 hypothetical protein [Streptomyces europaeiscabiei]MDX3702522.1 hypothetical protein [Streptomyces europaeiscabiei]GAQ66685.1 hypothetical protein SsS58_07120 [Streptomyces scabiei]